MVLFSPRVEGGDPEGVVVTLGPVVVQEFLSETAATW